MEREWWREVEKRDEAKEENVLVCSFGVQVKGRGEILVR